jgi:hypothetical protein
VIHRAELLAEIRRGDRKRDIQTQDSPDGCQLDLQIASASGRKFAARWKVR